MRPVDEQLSRPGGLAERLYGLRRAAGLGTGELASRLGWPPSKVTKLQRGQQRPKVEDITAWCGACGHPEAASELLDMLAEADAVHWRWQQRLSRGGGLSGIQEDLERQERQARRIRSVQIAVMPGILQTAEYARHMLVMFCKILARDPAEVEAAVAARMRRQDVLYEPGRSFEFVITENVLRRFVGSPQVMMGQMDRLTNLAGLGNIEIGIIPDGARLDVFPYQAFLMLDDRVSVEGSSAEDRLPQDDMGVYERQMDMFMAASARGEDALRLIADAAAYWREQA